MGLRNKEKLPITSIDVSRLNSRKKNVQQGLEVLAQSIRQHGLLQPVVVFKKGDRYELIIGQRRFLSCRDILKWTEIPARVVSVPSDKEAVILSFSENIHRLDLDPKDKMNVAIDLLAKLGSVRKVANALGIHETTVRTYLGYAGVPDKIKDLVTNRKISAQTATEIAQNIPDEKKAFEIAEMVIEAPRGDPRRVLIDVAKEYPEKSADEIQQLAKKLRFKKITLHLSPRIAAALDSACHHFSIEGEAIAKNALEEWLNNRGFLK